jgi:hypothetical protein
MEKVSTSKLKEICRFKHEEVEYKLIEPSAAAVREAKFRHNKKFTDCLKEKIFTKSRMQKELEADNPEFFSEFNDIRNTVLQELTNTEKEISETEDPDRLEALSQIMTIYRAHLVDQEQMIRTIFQSTCDEMAEEEKNSYLAYSMVRNLDESLLAETYEEFLDKYSFEFFDLCKYQLLCWEHGLNPSWQEELPEVKAALRAQELREVAEKKAKELEEAKKAEKTKKKTTSKKTSSKKTTTAKTKKASSKSKTKKTTKKGKSTPKSEE